MIKPIADFLANFKMAQAKHRLKLQETAAKMTAFEPTFMAY